MKREIKFRGKRVRTEDPLERWIEGSYVEYTNIRDEKIIKIMSQSGYMNDINPETVGQFTGLCDKNGVNCVFEGDILSLHGTLIGNIYENKDLLKDETNFVINGLCTKEWCYTYQEAIKRGCVDAK